MTALQPVFFLVASGIFILLPRAYGMAFVLAGHIIFYTTLYIMDVETSAVLAGGTMSIAGSVTLLRMIMDKKVRSRGRSWLSIAFFGIFIAIWYLRWMTEKTGSIADQEFAQRVYYFMIAFAVFPFLYGMLANRNDLQELYRGICLWGLAGLAILVVFAIVSPIIGPMESRWSPIPNLNGITMALNCGVGYMALILLRSEKKKINIIKILVGVIVITIGVKIGQRGPVLFLLVGIFAYLLMEERFKRAKRLLVFGIALSIVTYIIMDYNKKEQEVRVVNVDSYGYEENLDRIDLITGGMEKISERPMIGWGGSLVGKRIHSRKWQYSHVWMLDGLIETGIIGAVFQYALLFICINAIRRMIRKSTLVELRILILPMMIYVFLEAQVSGHLSTNSQLWLLIGFCANRENATEQMKI